MSLPNLFGDDLPAPAPTMTPVATAQTQSLYRKYRPQSFDSAELVGQEHIVRTIRNAIRQNRVAHAYLFCGPRGTGKTTTARLLAKAVNCLDPDVMNRPCNVCTSCIAINSGATSDVIEIDAASNRGIDDIRDLRERVKYAPTQLQTKFYIIDEAHQITGAAANAFLKTLEEPPPHTKFVLATTDPEELLSTIVSRCQRFDFRRIGIGATIARLRAVATAERIPITDEALETIARHATGSLRDALGLLDQLAVYGEHEDASVSITADSVRALLGVSRNDRVERLVEALSDRDASLALGAVNEAVEQGEDPRQLNRQLVAYLRVLLHERAGGSPDADQRAKELAARFELPVLGRLARIFSETDYKIRHSPYAQLPLEIALVEAIVGGSDLIPASAQLPSSAPGTGATTTARPTDDELMAAPSTSSLKDRLRQGGRGNHLHVIAPGESAPPEPAVHAAPASDSAKTPASPVIDSTQASAGLSVGQLADLWPQIRNDVKAVNRRIEALLASIDPVAVTGANITLAAAYDFHRKRMNEDEVRGVVEDAISRVIGQPVTILCVMRGEALPPAAQPQVAAPILVVERPVIEASPDEPESASTQLAAENEARSTATAAGELDPAEEYERDLQRLQAAKNIFDAEEVPS
jgi:DNA polymerase III subunit gamma/tau